MRITKKEISIPMFVAIVVVLIVAIPTYYTIQEEKEEMLYEGAIPIDIEVNRYCKPYQPTYCGAFTVTPRYVQVYADEEFWFAHDCIMGTQEDEV